MKAHAPLAAALMTCAALTPGQAAWGQCYPVCTPVCNSVIPLWFVVLPGPGDTYPPALNPEGNPYTIILRDCLNQPYAGLPVFLDFSLAGDIVLSDTQEPGMVLDCAARRLHGVTDAQGRVTFVVRGAGANSLPGGGIGPGGFGQVRVAASSTVVATVTAATPDQNGAGAGGTVVNGVDPSDGSFMRYDVFNYPFTAGRSDLSGSGMVDPADLSVFRDFLFNDAASAAPQTTSYCP